MTMTPAEEAAAMAIVQAALSYVHEYGPLLEAIRDDPSFAAKEDNRQRVALLDAVEKWRYVIVFIIVVAIIIVAAVMGGVALSHVAF